MEMAGRMLLLCCSLMCVGLLHSYAPDPTKGLRTRAARQGKAGVLTPVANRPRPVVAARRGEAGVAPASVRGIITLDGILESLGGMGRGFGGMQGLDVGQEADFVLSLSGAAQVPPSSCRILSVYTRSSDRQTDVSFELVVDTVVDAEEYSRKIRRLIDDGRLTSVLSTNGLPKAFARFHPAPFASGLPVPFANANDRTFSTGFILGLALPILSFAVGVGLAIFKYQVLELLELRLRLSNEEPPEEGWDSAFASRNWLRNPNSPFASEAQSPRPFASEEQSPREIIVEEEASFADILSSMRDAGKFGDGDTSGETEEGMKPESREGNDQEEGQEEGREWEIELESEGKAPPSSVGESQLYSHHQTSPSAARCVPAVAYIPELVQIESNGAHDLYGLNLGSVPLLSPIKASPPQGTARDYSTRESFSPTLGLIDPLERCTSTFPASPEGTLHIIPEEESDSTRQTPIEDTESGGNVCSNRDIIGDGLGVKEARSSLQRQEALQGNSNSFEQQQGDAPTDAPPSLSALEPAPFNLPNVENARNIPKQDEDGHSSLLSIGTTAQRESLSESNFKFQAPFIFQGDEDASVQHARTPGSPDDFSKSSLLSKGELPPTRVVCLQRALSSKKKGDGRSSIRAGIGLAFERDPDGNHTVIGLRPDGAAAHSNQIHVCDKILSIDGIPTQGESVEAVRQRMLGAEGTHVTLTLMDENRKSVEIRPGNDSESSPFSSTVVEQERGSELESQDALDYLTLANDLQKSHYYDSSLEYYDTGMTKAKGSGLKCALLFNRSVAYARLGSWDKALSDVVSCLRLCPGWQPAVDWQEACLEQHAQAMDDGLSSMSDNLAHNIDTAAAHHPAEQTSPIRVPLKSGSSPELAPSSMGEPALVAHKSLETSPYGPFDSPLDNVLHSDKQRETIMQMLNVLQEAEKFVDEKVAGIKSVALSHIAREHAMGAADGSRHAVGVSDGPKSTGMFVDEDLQVEVVLDLDYSLSVGREDDLKRRIERDLARAVNGNRRKVHVWKLSAGSVIAHVHLQAGFALDGRSLHAVLEDLQLQLQNPESLLKKGDVTRDAIRVSLALGNAEPSLPAHSSPPVANSTVGADLTAWAVDKMAATPELELASRSGQQVRTDDWNGVFPSSPDGGVARKLFANVSVPVPEFLAQTANDSHNNSLFINATSERNTREPLQDPARSRWRVAPSASKDVRRISTQDSPDSSLSKSSIPAIGWEPVSPEERKWWLRSDSSAVKAVSPEERNWWLGGNGGMTGGIARLMRSGQRALAQFRSPLSTARYSPHHGSCSRKPAHSSMLSPKLEKRSRESFSDLEDTLDRSAFAWSQSPPYDSIARARVLSTKASVNEIQELSAHAGFFRPEDGSVSSPRSQRPPPMLNPSAEKSMNKAQKKRRVRRDSWRIRKQGQGTDERKEREKMPSMSFSSRSPSGSPQSSPPDRPKGNTVAAISAAHEAAIEGQAAASRAAVSSWPKTAPLKGSAAPYCIQCGSQVPFAALFCPMCGRHVVSMPPISPVVGLSAPHQTPTHEASSRSSTPVQPVLDASPAKHPPSAVIQRQSQDRREREKFRIRTPRGAVWATGVIEQEAHESPRAAPPPSISLKLTPRNSQRRLLVQDQEQRVEISLLPEAINKPATSPVAAEGVVDQENVAALDVSVRHFLEGHFGVLDDSDSGSEGVEEQVSLEAFQSGTLGASPKQGEAKEVERRTRGTEDIELDFRHNMLEEAMDWGKEDDGEKGCVEMGKVSAVAGSQEEKAAEASLRDTRVVVSKGRNVWEERIARDKQEREGREGSRGPT